MSMVIFQVGKSQLTGNFFKAKSPEHNLAFLFLHGWTGQQNTDAAKKMAKNGFTSMTFSMRGHNGSDGNLNEFRTSDFLQDAIAGYDYFVQQLPPGTEICVAGNSFGCYVAILLAEKRPVKCLELRVPANYPDETFNDYQIYHSETERRKSLNKWRKQESTHSENMALRVLHSFEGAVQILEAENDTQVDSQTVKNYVQAIKDPAKLEYILWKDAPHSIGSDVKLKQEYLQYLLSWAIKQTI